MTKPPTIPAQECVLTVILPVCKVRKKPYPSAHAMTHTRAWLVLIGPQKRPVKQLMHGRKSNSQETRGNHSHAEIQSSHKHSLSLAVELRRKAIDKIKTIPFTSFSAKQRHVEHKPSAGIRACHQTIASVIVFWPRNSKCMCLYGICCAHKVMIWHEENA